MTDSFGEQFDEVLAASSLGTANARAIRAMTPPHVVDALTDRAGTVRVDDVLDLGGEEAPRYLHLPPAPPRTVRRCGRVLAVHATGVDVVRDDGLRLFVPHDQVQVLHDPPPSSDG